ncbi:hypothetical protein Metli_1699 [Methanofollis liminatans DSM 4140]|uniref:Right handed beta helix domain-containing protein n=1 Tax=Methanofollis liminatans DSM 4140 TaxID=28892 RepID=J0SAE0_9EURY|nr:hypothetical protein [Methanofollis liminatans]EJG07644.1 hypothetical protein Metli_1699 [Methanofollis liminatans DSM 4140]
MVKAPGVGILLHPRLLFALMVLFCVMLTAPAAAVALPDRVAVNESYTDQTPDYGYLNFSSIQEAIDGVATGGEVWVHNGTYREALVIDRSMSVLGVSALTALDEGIPILDVPGEAIGVEITADNVTFSGFEVANATEIGIFAHGADAVSLEHNYVSLLNDAAPDTCGILVEDGAGACIGDNMVLVMGSGHQMGVTLDRAPEARVRDNRILAASRAPEVGPVEVGAVNLVLAALVPEDNKPLSTIEEEQYLSLAPDGVTVLESPSVLVEGNQVVSMGLGDEVEGVYVSADVWGIRSCDSESASIIENEVTVVGLAPNRTRTLGIHGAGDLTLIEGNTVEISTVSSIVQPVGIRLGWAEKGRVLNNTVSVEVECASTGGNDGRMRPAGITAFESVRAQVTRNDISYTLSASGSPETCRVAVEGIYLEECDACRVSENVAVVESMTIRDRTRDGDDDLLRVSGSVNGIDVYESDEPEILENVVETFGGVFAHDGGTPDEPFAGIAGELMMTGISVRGWWDEPVQSPVVDGNAVSVSAQSMTFLGPLSGVFGDALADNSDLQARYAAVMDAKENRASALSAFEEVEGLDVDLSSALAFEPRIDEVCLAQVRTVTAGIVLEDVVDPTVCRNIVPVSLNALSLVSSLPVGEEEAAALCEGAMPLGLIEQAFAGEQMQQAAVLSLIDENGDAWQNLSVEERAAITDAVINGDADALALYAETDGLFPAGSGVDEIIAGYQEILESDELFGFLNGTRLAAAVPVSMNYGLLYTAEGETQVYENTFSVLTSSIGIAVAESENADVPDAAAGSAGLVTSFGIIGTSDAARLAENTVEVGTSGIYLNIASGSDIETSDAAAGTAHLFLAAGICADGDESLVQGNNITVLQTTEAIAEAVALVKDRIALSVAATAGVGVGIVLDAGTILDAGTYAPVPPTMDDAFGDVIQGNTVSVTDEINVASLAGMLLDPPLDGSSHALSAAVGAAASFGIVAPEASVLDNTVSAVASQNSMAVAEVTDLSDPVILAAGSGLPGAGAANLGIAASGGIVTLRSCITNNTVFTAANAEGTVEAATEELLEDAGILGVIGVINVGIVSLNPSYIDANTVDGEAWAALVGMCRGDRVDGETQLIGLDLGILSVGGDATFNTINNGYAGFPYSYDGEVYEPYATHNWWGDASGPSGTGPGTGSPVYGAALYEPWLTRPADVVLETGKSYFGLEIGSPFIGGDGYRTGLEPGWNTLSFPLALENATWGAATGLGDGLDYAVAYAWDAGAGRWVQVTDASTINPLDAVYVRMNDYDRLPVRISPEVTSPPTRTLEAGWNLVGPAYALVGLPEPIGQAYFWWGEPYGTSVTTALTTVAYTPDGRDGYTVVVSPSINPESWVFTRGDDAPDMDATCGYWVYMENPATLAGFSTTPLPMPEWAWNL